MGIVGYAQAAGAGSTHYTLQHPTLDAGGGLAASAHYIVVNSLGVPGGIARSANASVTERHGFPSVLNDPPLPQADTVRRTDGQFVKVWITNLLANDADPERDLLRLRTFDALSAAGGRVTLDNGWLFYEAPGMFPGTDTFTCLVEDQAGNAVRTLVTVLLTGPDGGLSLDHVAVGVLPDGHRRISFAGIAGRSYAIEWAENLPATRWETLATVPADGQGVIEWVDAMEPAPPKRYYRTVSR